jgi:hypothetical protein
MNALFEAPGGRIEQNHPCRLAQFIPERRAFAQISDDRGPFTLFGNSAPANIRATTRAGKIAGKESQCQPPRPNFAEGESIP